MDIGVFDTFFWVGLRHRRGSAFVKWSCRDLMGPCRICKEHKRLEYMIYDVFCEIKQVHIAEEIMHKNSVQFSIRRTDPQRRRLSPSKKVPKVPILILTPVSQNPFYVYWPKHDFLQIHNGRAKIWPSKTTTKDSSRFASSPHPKLPSKSGWAIYCEPDWCASLVFAVVFRRTQPDVR